MSGPPSNQSSLFWRQPVSRAQQNVDLARSDDLCQSGSRLSFSIVIAYGLPSIAAFPQGYIMVDSSRRDSNTSTRHSRRQYRADYSSPMFDAQHQASTGLKWPLIIDFSTVSGSLIVTGVPIWSHLHRITARCREMLSDCCSRCFLLVFVPEIQLSPCRY